MPQKSRPAALVSTKCKPVCKSVIHYLHPIRQQWIGNLQVTTEGRATGIRCVGLYFVVCSPCEVVGTLSVLLMIHWVSGSPDVRNIFTFNGNQSTKAWVASQNANHQILFTSTAVSEYNLGLVSSSKSHIKLEFVHHREQCPLQRPSG